MPETSYIQAGGLKCEKQISGKYLLYKILLYCRKVVLYSLPLAFSYMVTKYVFSTCIISNDLQNTTNIPLSDCISLGSIFATFGSAVISVLTLTSSSQISSFEQKLAILKGHFSTHETSAWIRWEFLPRLSRKHIRKGQYNYYRLDNPTLCFKMETSRLSLPIPTVRKDFCDLPIFSSWCKMYIYKNRYRVYIYKKNCISDFLVWDCLMSMYKNIIIYRISEYFVWVGATFVINSILYAFSYH